MSSIGSKLDIWTHWIGAMALATSFGCAADAQPGQEHAGDVATEGADSAELRAEEPGSLAVDAREGHETVVAARRREFATWDAFFLYAQQDLNAEPVFDDDGRLVGVRGTTFVTGRPAFRDAESGETYGDDDFVAGYLGGGEGVFQVAGIEVHVGASHPTGVASDEVASTALALSEKQEVCNTGGDCVKGETWVTHYPWYHSVGSKTVQSAGGYRTIYGLCCPAGAAKVNVDGATRCRRYLPGAYEWDEFLRRRILLYPHLHADSDPYSCSKGKVRSNQLLVRAQVYSSPTFSVTWERLELNTDEVRVSQWHAGPGSGFLGEVSGACGRHWSSRGGSTDTSDGYVGDNDVLCGRNAARVAAPLPLPIHSAVLGF